MDYGKYRLEKREEILCILVAVVLSIVAAWLLYQKLWGMLLFSVIYPFYRNAYQKKCVEMQQRELLVQFKDTILSISAALLSGYAVENAWKEAEKEVSELYGEQSYMAVELRNMNAGIRMNQPVELLLYDFSIRSGNEEIINFAEVFRFAKRSGGKFAKIMHEAAMRISEKHEIEQEIQTIVAGKRMEQTVMNVIPIGILGYLNLTSGDFLAPLYGNLFGIIIMTGAFVAYLGALYLSGKIMNIKF